MNLKSLDGAKQVWALENGKRPSDIPKDSELFGEALYIRRKPTCMDGGVYAVGKVGEPPTCSIKGHALRIPR